MQYLGAKTRALDIIVSECEQLYRSNSFVVDLFSGSSIVSQALYQHKMSVIANDVLQFCVDISSCLLNVSKTGSSSSLLRDAIKKMASYTINPIYIEPLSDYVAQECRFIKEKDLLGLKGLYSHFPLVCNDNSLFSKQVETINNNIGKVAFNNFPLITYYYAGTYFGISQSIKLDTIRGFIEEYYIYTKDYWVYSAMLTALYSTLSTIVHSAGKHFAQPIIITDLDKEKITNIRLFENRNYKVDDLYIDFLNSILSKTENSITPSNCISVCHDFESDGFRRILDDKDISVIYADPPYTAQQYSRFYHIPEVVRSYRYPKLQLFKGHFTQGLYPEGKFKSGFCSKTKAKEAFRSLFGLVKDKQCSLILSYSESKKKETGNERMVSRNEILSLSDEFLPNYKVKQIGFDFEYRQLNSSSKVVRNKDDKEFLIIFEKG